MGQNSSKKEEKIPTPYEHVTRSSPIGEKELRATWEVMEANKANRLEYLEKEVVAVDNSACPYNYQRVDLPLDADGYCQSFSVDEPKEFCAFFKKYGVVVIRDILSKEECGKSEAEIWCLLSRMSNGKIKEGEPDTWEKWVSLSKLGILGNDCILSEQMFENRQNPNLYKAFRHLLGTEDLMVNVGRASMMRPTKNVQFKDGVRDKPEWKTISQWLHLDMNPWNGWTTTFSWTAVDNEKNRGYDRTKVQSWVSLTDCGPNDGGFHCVPGFAPHIRGWAHKNLDHFNPKNFDTTFQIPKDDPIRKDIQRVPVKAGSLVVWDSKTPHGTFPNDSNHGRIIQYIKMADKSDESITHLFQNENLLPSGWEPTPLGRRLLGFDTSKSGKEKGWF